MKLYLLMLAFRTVLILAVTATGAWCQDRIERSNGRVPLPQWRTVPSIFFEDAFQDALAGPWPPERQTSDDSTGGNPSGSGRGTESGGSVESGANGEAGATVPWANIIAAEVLEDEVKRLQIAVEQTVTSPGRYRSRDYKTARSQFQLLAAYFGVIEQYGADVRWQNLAGGLRTLLAGAAEQAEARSEASFQAAQLARDTLRDVVRGIRVNDLPAPLPLDDWSRFTDRAAMMVRIGQATDERLPAALADDQTDTRRSALNEAQVVRTLARLLVQPGLEDAQDDDYVDFCRQLEEAARQVQQALDVNDIQSARTTAGKMHQTCDACHELYRG